MTTHDTDPELLELLRTAGDRWGPRGVAEVAARLSRLTDTDDHLSGRPVPGAFRFTERPEDPPLTLEQAVFETLGYASMCWSEAPRGVFDSTRAEQAGNALVERIRRGDLA